LKELLIRGNKLKNEDMETFLYYLTRNWTLEKIDLLYNSFTDEGCKHISNFLVSNKNLKFFNFSYNNITKEGLNSIISISLVENTTLKTISFAGLGLGDGDSTLINTLFVMNRGLEEIILNHNTFTHYAINTWKKDLKTNTRITCLHLTANPIGKQGAQELIEILKENKVLNKLILRACSIPSAFTDLANFPKKHNRDIIIDTRGN
jgi:Ran GTPase-activating protein (RanGAP) involved in mRNA processing and transport